jgi:hypothetical protein
MGLLGVFFLAVAAVCCLGHHAWAVEGREGVIDGRNLADFDGTGRIDSLENDQIVINDMQKRLSPRVEYYRQGRIKTKRSSFSIGAKVGYIANSKGEIISLWLLR